jgi:hypothetical protein
MVVCVGGVGLQPVFDRVAANFGVVTNALPLVLSQPAQYRSRRRAGSAKCCQ